MNGFAEHDRRVLEFLNRAKDPGAIIKRYDLRRDELPEAGPQFGMPGYEVNLLYIAGLLALFLRGPTHLSVDQKLAESKGGSGPAM